MWVPKPNFRYAGKMKIQQLLGTVSHFQTTRNCMLNVRHGRPLDAAYLSDVLIGIACQTTSFDAAFGLATTQFRPDAPPFSVAVESERTTFRTPSRDACKLNRRAIVNGQRLSFPTQLMKRTTCQPHDCTARTVLGDAEHQVRASPGKCVAASIHRAGGQWDEIGEKCRDGRCERPRLTTAPRSPNAFTGTRRVCQYVTE